VDLYKSAIVAGIAVGGLYALIAVGVTHSFKVTRVLNFAQAGFILWGAYFYSYFSISLRWPVALGAITSVMAVALMGLVTEATVFRFAARATILSKTLLTFAVLLFLTALAVKIFGAVPRNAPQLFPLGGIKVLGTGVSWDQIANIAATLIAVLAIGAFLRFTKTGMLTRAVAEDATMAGVLGARRRRIDALSWAMGAGLAGLAGVLIAPSTPFSSGDFLGYFVIALVATLVGGLQSLPMSALGGLAVGVIHTVAPVRFNELGSGDLAVFLLVALLVLVKRSWPEESSKLAWSRPARTRVHSRLFLVPGGLMVLGWLALVLAAATSAVWAGRASLILMYVLAALSLMPVIGWTGQISLAQGGLLGVGAFATAEAANHYHLAFPLAVLVGIGAGALAGGVLGIVCRRLSFVLTAVTSLAFTAAVSSWFLDEGHIFHTVGGTTLINVPGYLDSDRKIFVGAALLVGLAVATMSSVRKSRWGVRFAAVKDTPVMAAHFGVSPTRTRIYAFCLSGGLAGAAGVIYGVILQNLSSTDFNVGLSLEILLYAVAGGVTVLYGPFMAGLAFLGVPQFLGLAKYGATGWPDLIAGAGAVQLLSSSDDGMAGVIRRGRVTTKRKQRRPGGSMSEPSAGLLGSAADLIKTKSG
jgi:branched-chain amino acid transport system permease protein